ncbi:hypothetical protein HDV05_000414 [Chytridiales sp. JEL 0842]|nr:hypothetical protein HDV05_000414 [Chytridiales sp. JEL 0842]
MPEEDSMTPKGLEADDPQPEPNTATVYTTPAPTPRSGSPRQQGNPATTKPNRRQSHSPSTANSLLLLASAIDNEDTVRGKSTRTRSSKAHMPQHLPGQSTSSRAGGSGSAVSVSDLVADKSVSPNTTKPRGEVVEKMSTSPKQMDQARRQSNLDLLAASVTESASEDLSRKRGADGGSSSQSSSPNKSEGEDAQPQKRSKLSINTTEGGQKMGSNGVPITAGVPTAGPVSSTGFTDEVMQQYQMSLKVKEQQKALIEARQKAGPTSAGPTPPSMSPPRADGGAGKMVNRRNSLRNSKNLTIMTPTTSEAPKSAVPSSAPIGPGSQQQGSAYMGQMNAPGAVSYTPGQSNLRHAANKGPMTASQTARYLGPPSAANMPGPSPRNEFPSRELPMPISSSQHEPPRSPHPGFFNSSSSSSSSSSNAVGGAGGGKGNMPPPSPSSAYPTSAYPYPHPGGASTTAGGVTVPRSTFLSVFESLYDSADEVPKLTSTLRDQIRKSSSLLQTLQASGTMIEGLVRSCFRDMQVQYGERFGATLNEIQKRLEVVEDKLGIVPPPATVPSTNVNNGFRGEPQTPVVGSSGPNVLSSGGPKSGGSLSSSGLVGNHHSESDLIRSLLERIEVLEKRTGGSTPVTAPAPAATPSSGGPKSSGLKSS